MNTKYDVIIKNTFLIDGTGEPGFHASIAIKDRKISAIGDLKGNAEKIIDGKGLVTCPGFIDPHSHADRAIIKDPVAENLLAQGITTFAGGNCGSSLAPLTEGEYECRVLEDAGVTGTSPFRTFGQFLKYVSGYTIGPNYIPLVGHNTIRRSVLGRNYARKSSNEELVSIQNMLRESFESGAFGFSMGLDGNMPGHFAGMDELVSVASIAREYGAIFTPHTRHHQNQWPASEPFECAYGIFDSPAGEIIAGRYHGLMEAIELCRMAGYPRLHIAHMTPAYIIPQPHPLYVDEILARATIEEIVEKAEKEGMDITYNVIPSENSIGGRQRIIDTFFGKTLNLPKWIRDMDAETFSAELKNAAFRERVRNLMFSGKMKIFMVHPLTDPYWADDYMVLDCSLKEYENKTIWEVAREREPNYTIKAVYEESYNVLFDILAEDPNATWTLVKDKREYGCYHVFLSHRLGLPCTDYVYPPVVKTGNGKVVQGNYGMAPSLCNMFLKYFEVMVVKKKLLSLEEAVRKVTSFPAAKIFGIKDRGILKEGAFADIVVMDFKNLEIPDDYREPEKTSPSMKYVFVNGTVAYEKGKATGKRNGMVLRRNHEKNG